VAPDYTSSGAPSGSSSGYASSGSSGYSSSGYSSSGESPSDYSDLDAPSCSVSHAGGGASSPATGVAVLLGLGAIGAAAARRRRREAVLGAVLLAGAPALAVGTTGCADGSVDAPAVDVEPAVRTVGELAPSTKQAVMPAAPVRVSTALRADKVVMLPGIPQVPSVNELSR
jgi:MYXO-CTERM domain-containing protein